MEERVKEAMASSRELEQQLEDERHLHSTATTVSHACAAISPT